MLISVETSINKSIDRIWSAYTKPEEIVQWNFASDDWHTTKSTVDLRVGGTFSSRMEAKDGSFGFDFAGVYTNIIPKKLIEYNLGERKAKVEFIESNKSVMVKVTFDTETENSIEQQKSGWQAILDNFSKYVLSN